MNIRFLASAAIALCCTSVFAQSEMTGRSKTNCAKPCSNQKRPDVPLCNVPPAYNVPARITGCGGAATFEVDASYLYWCIAQEGMDLGVSGTLDGGDIVNPNMANIPVIPNQYKSGFRVGIGANTTFDDWQVRLEYTYLHRTKTYTVGNTTTPGSLVDGDTVYSLSDWYAAIPDMGAPVVAGFAANWKMNFDALDLSLSRPFYQGERLIITPYAGLLGISVRQHFNISAYAIDETVDTSNNRYRSWGIGPEVGSNFSWLIGSGFRVQADAQFSLLYTSFDKQKHSQVLAGTPYNGQLSDQAYIRPYFDLSLGLGYGVYFRDSYHFDLFAGYEFVNISQQNVMRNNAGIFNGYTSPTPDLSFHGLTASARFDF